MAQLHHHTPRTLTLPIPKIRGGRKAEIREDQREIGMYALSDITTQGQSIQTHAKVRPT
jgi:hypothetical protein